MHDPIPKKAMGRPRKPRPLCRCGCGTPTVKRDRVFAPGHCRAELKKKGTKPESCRRASALNMKRRQAAWHTSGKLKEVLVLSKMTAGTPDHRSAKAWTLRSPEGVTYHCQNLAGWARKHEHLFQDINPDAKQPFWRRIHMGLGQAYNQRNSSYRDWVVIAQPPVGEKTSMGDLAEGL